MTTAHRPIRLRSLSPERRSLVALCQSLPFGRLENLRVAGGEPILDPPPRIVREVKLGGENDPRPELAQGDFVLKSQLVDLFFEFDKLGDGNILVLEVKHGLPFRMLIGASIA